MIGVQSKVCTFLHIVQQGPDISTDSLGAQRARLLETYLSDAFRYGKTGLSDKGLVVCIVALARIDFNIL